MDDWHGMKTTDAAQMSIAGAGFVATGSIETVPNGAKRGMLKQPKIHKAHRA